LLTEIEINTCSRRKKNSDVKINTVTGVKLVGKDDLIFNP
jgi:hypothetical protein